MPGAALLPANRFILLLCTVKRHYRHITGLRLVMAAIAAAILAACASMGRPEGGPVDETPPVYIRSNPAPGARNVSRQRLELFFDENLKVEDAMNKVVVSPAQKTPPRVTANGRRLSVELRDTLIPDVTYTIDFADAIRDLNEGNILDGFAMDFATGDHIDSLRISGMIFEAETLEPAQGMLVGVYNADTYADSAITTRALERIAKTDQLGRFTIRGLAEGRYRIWAVNDVNRDYHWDRSEDVAFYDVTVVPTTAAITVTDTLTSALGTDSVATRPGVQFLPNDVLMTWFNERYRPQYLLDNKRTDSLTVTLTFNAPSDTLPSLTILDGPMRGVRLDEVSVLQRNVTNDTLRYWLRHPQVISDDSLRVAARYLKTDTLDRLVWVTDTLRLGFRRPKPQKRHDDDTIAPPAPTVRLTVGKGARQDLYLPLSITTERPLDAPDLSRLRLSVQQDTLWLPVPADTWAVEPDTAAGILAYTLRHAWTPGAKYRVEADSAAFADIYGNPNARIETSFDITQPEDYASLALVITGAPDSVPMMAQLLDAKDTPLRTVAVTDGTALFSYINPGTYYIRAFADCNGDGIWTTGDVTTLRQPEDVYYYPKRFNLKKNWDVSQTWNINELPVDLQKPDDIKKNKPKTRDGAAARRPGDEEDEEEEEGFGNNLFDTGGRSTQYNDNHRNDTMRR